MWVAPIILQSAPVLLGLIRVLNWVALDCTGLGQGVIGTKGLGPGLDNKELRKSSETDQELKERAKRELKIAKR